MVKEAMMEMLEKETARDILASQEIMVQVDKIQSPVIFWATIATCCDIYASNQDYGLEYILNGFDDLKEAARIVWETEGDMKCSTDEK